MVDYSEQEPISVFESANILLYLAEKFDAFLPKAWAERTEVLNWLFYKLAPLHLLVEDLDISSITTAQEYPINRYTMETKRQLDLLDQLLATREYIAGNTYTIADIAIWSWYGRLAQGLVSRFSRIFRC